MAKDEKAPVGKKCLKIIVIFLVLANILSVIAICLSLQVFEPSSMSFLGWTIAVLSMLVVVLMGWHIFSIFDLKEVRDSFVKKYAKMKSKIENIFSMKSAEIDSKIEDVFNAKSAEIDSKIKKYENNIRYIEGLAYENINIDESITNYLSVIEEALDMNDAYFPNLGMNRMSALLNDRKEEVKRAINTIPIIHNLANKIMKHGNFGIISNRFNIFIKQIDENGRYFSINEK